MKNNHWTDLVLDLYVIYVPMTINTIINPPSLFVLLLTIREVISELYSDLMLDHLPHRHHSLDNQSLLSIEFVIHYDQFQSILFKEFLRQE